jgi:GntR family transcriptional regulator
MSNVVSTTAVPAAGVRSLPSGDVDRNSPIPFYFQLSEMLEAEIVSGRWAPGQRLASEHELCERFQLSRTTVRQALVRLEQEGLINRRKGQGTFVERGRPRSWLLQSSDGFFQDEVGRMGREVSSKLRRRETGLLPRWASDALALPPGSEGVSMERLRSVDGRIAMLVSEYLPVRLAETVLALDLPSDSLYRRLATADGVEVAGGRRTLEAVQAGSKLAELLEVRRSAPLVFIESVAWDRTLTPFHCYRTWVRTDRMRIDIEVASSPRGLG